jgi:hypothetical protein
MDIGIPAPIIGMTRAPAGIATAKATMRAIRTWASDLGISRRYCRTALRASQRKQH